MSSKLTRRLLRASEEDFHVFSASNDSSTTASVADGRITKRSFHSTPNESPSSLSDSYVFAWHVRSLVDADRKLSSFNPSNDLQRNGKLKKHEKSKNVTKELLKGLERRHTTESLRRRIRISENMGRGSTRTAPAIAKMPYVPTYNKNKYLKNKDNKEHNKLAKKLKALKSVGKKKA